MDHIIRIHRKKGFYGFGTPLCVKFGAEPEFKLFVGQDKTLTMSNVPTPLSVGMYGNALQFHKVKSEKVVFPEYQKSETIVCEISIKPNWVGCLTLGLLQPVSKIQVDINY